MRASPCARARAADRDQILSIVERAERWFPANDGTDAGQTAELGAKIRRSMGKFNSRDRFDLSDSRRYTGARVIRIRRALDRGHADHGWLKSDHTFSFAGYRDPEHMGFRALRVINEDRVEAGRGFDSHSHRDMEILSFVLEGTLAHKDSMNNGSLILPGDIQLMRAGTGVTHSEYNDSTTELVHFLQIWIVPDETGLEPAYDQRHFAVETRRNVLRLIASRDGREDSVCIHQDADLYASVLEKGEAVEFGLAENRHAWVQVTRGSARLNDDPLNEGDGAAISGESKLRFAANDSTDFLLFDLA